MLNRRKLINIHRWIFIFLGIVTVAWMLSGVLMIMPQGWLGSAIAWYKPLPVDYRSAVLSPADAIRQMEARLGQPAGIDDVKLTRIEDMLFYAIRTHDGSEHLVSAADGSQFEITPEFAVRLVRRTYGIDAPVSGIATLDGHDFAYPWGALPAWRISFEDNPVSYTVNPGKLNIIPGDRFTVLRLGISSLHEFSPLEWLTGSDLVRHGLLLAAGLIALLGAVAGVWLTLPRRRRTRRTGTVD